MSVNSFVDCGHKVAFDFFEIQKSFNGHHISRVKRELLDLIQRDPNYFDPYLLLYDILIEEEYVEEAEEILSIAYEKILERIITPEGKWPDRLEWGWDENRHIIRILYNKAMSLFREDRYDEAEELFGRLFITNPNDNLGVRYYILAIRENLSYPEFEERFVDDGYYNEKIDSWFLDRSSNYPQLFEWWLKKFQLC